VILPFQGSAGEDEIRNSLVNLPGFKYVFKSFHIHPVAFELDALQLEASPLLACGYPLQLDFPSCTQDAMPR
jgi:hypothetical protein